MDQNILIAGGAAILILVLIVVVILLINRSSAIDKGNSALRPEKVDTGVVDVPPSSNVINEEVVTKEKKQILPLSSFKTNYVPPDCIDYNGTVLTSEYLPINKEVNSTTKICNINKVYYSSKFTLKCTMSTHALPNVPVQMYDSPTHTFLTVSPYQEYIKNIIDHPYNNAIPCIFANKEFIFIQVGKYKRYKYRCDAKLWYNIELVREDKKIKLTINDKVEYEGELEDDFYKVLFNEVPTQVTLMIHGSNDIKNIKFY